MVPKLNSEVAIRKLKRAAPYILAGLSAIGVFATAFLSAKATVKAVDVVKKKELKEKEDIFKATWKFYIPTALTTLATAACIIGGCTLSKKQQASILSAYALLNRNYKQYIDKVKELYGEEGHKKIIESIAAEKAKDIPNKQNPYIDESFFDFEPAMDDEEVQHLFYDSWAERYFTASMARVLKAEIRLNERVAHGLFVSVNDFYEYIGIEPLTGCDEIGWTLCAHYTTVPVIHYKANLEDAPEGLEAIVIEDDWVPQFEDEWLEY